MVYQKALSAAWAAIAPPAKPSKASAVRRDFQPANPELYAKWCEASRLEKKAWTERQTAAALQRESARAAAWQQRVALARNRANGSATQGNTAALVVVGGEHTSSK